MTPGLQALLSFTPIALSGVLLVGLGWSAKKAMPLVYVVTALIALMAWGGSAQADLQSGAVWQTPAWALGLRSLVALGAGNGCGVPAT